MKSKISAAAAVVLAAVGACAFTAPGHPAAAAVVHHITAVQPRTGFHGDRVCDLASTQLCMRGFDGEGQPVTGAASGDGSHLNMDEMVATQNCNNGKVSDGSAGEGPPCPWASGSGLNHQFNNDSIVLLLNHANAKRYAAFVEPSGWGVIEESGGSGELWVQQGDLSGLAPNAVFVNVEVSGQKGQAYIICTDGDGHQLPVNADNGNPPDTCRWDNAGPA